MARDGHLPVTTETPMNSMNSPSARPVHVLLIQCGPAEAEVEKNVEQNLALLEEGRRLGRTDFIVFSELSTTQYFCGQNDPRAFDLARPLDGPLVQRFAEVAKASGSYVLLTFFERGAVKGEFFNSVAVLSPAGELVPGTLPDGGRVSCYRKCHIPDQYSYAPGLNERYYFKGGPGLATFDTAHGRIGCLICYERSFPEAAGPRTTSPSPAGTTASPGSRSGPSPSRSRARASGSAPRPTPRCGARPSWATPGSRPR
jgi:predicted amidohydrolase